MSKSLNADFVDSIGWICRFLPANTSIKSAKWILLDSVLCTQKPHSLTLLNHTSHIPNFINFVPWLYEVTSTPNHGFRRSHQLHTMNECIHTKSVNSHSLLDPSSHFHSLNQMIFWANCVHSWFRVVATAFSHGTELSNLVTLAASKGFLLILWWRTLKMR